MDRQWWIVSADESREGVGWHEEEAKQEPNQHTVYHRENGKCYLWSALLYCYILTLVPIFGISLPLFLLFIAPSLLLSPQLHSLALPPSPTVTHPRQAVCIHNPSIVDDALSTVPTSWYASNGTWPSTKALASWWAWSELRMRGMFDVALACVCHR